MFVLSMLLRDVVTWCTWSVCPIHATTWCCNLVDMECYSYPCYYVMLYLGVPRVFVLLMLLLDVVTRCSWSVYPIHATTWCCNLLYLECFFYSCIHVMLLLVVSGVFVLSMLQRDVVTWCAWSVCPIHATTWCCNLVYLESLSNPWYYVKL